ncbi:MAG: CPBP family intramembrane metalloprotease, partial [Pirellulales bacterium]|nr:CPBP family intramembrane metalloprotease [Pirellulales bacterium]
AKSFKEAQAYLIPVMLLSITPGMISLMPGVTLSGPLAITPLLNIVLLTRDLLANSVQPAAALAAVISTAGYAAAALGIASRLFGSDAVTRTSQQSIGSMFRRPRLATDVPTPAAAALMLALLVPIYFVASNALIRLVNDNPESLTTSTSLMLNIFTLILTFGLVPLAAAYLGRNRFLTTYRLFSTSGACFAAALVMGLGAWIIPHEFFVLAQSMGIGVLDNERTIRTLAAVDRLREASPLLVVIALALTPAVIEELCFRGYLFSSFSRVMSPARTIALTSVLFGLFHVLTGGVLLIERFVPSTIMGVLLGWLAYRTGSVLPGMVLHFVHNGLLNLVIYYHDQVDFFPSELDDQAHLPLSWILGATVIAVAGCVGVWASTRNRGLQPTNLAPSTSASAKT